MAEKQLISTIIPVYNGERFLAEAIQSALNQSLPPAEILVVDDGSTDGSAAIARSFGPPVRVLVQPNLGPAAARNSGVQQATGDLLAFLDADDLWLPEKLAHQVQFLVDNPACQSLFGRLENFITPELDERQAARLAKSAGLSGAFHIGALLIHRAAFLRVGYFDVGRRHGEFIDWWGRAQQLGLPYAVLPELVMRRRLHTDNMTRREPDGRAEYVRLLRQHLARRQAAVSPANVLPETPCSRQRPSPSSLP